MKNLLALVGLAAVAVVNNANAETYQPPSSQFHSGSDCKNYYREDSSKFNHEIWGIVNMSTSPRYISCPIVDTEPFFARGTFGGIRVLFSGKGTITCSVKSHNSSGNVVQSQTASKTGSGWFTIPEITQDDPYASGFYTMHCQLPSYGWLQTYQVRQRVNF